MSVYLEGRHLASTLVQARAQSQFLLELLVKGQVAEGLIFQRPVLRIQPVESHLLLVVGKARNRRVDLSTFFLAIHKVKPQETFRSERAIQEISVSREPFLFSVERRVLRDLPDTCL